MLGCCGIFALSGCNSTSKDSGNQQKTEETTVINEGDYAALLPFTPSDASQKHAQTANNETETMNIGSGLMELSKQHFSPNTYTYRGGVHLDYDILDALDNSQGLLGRTSKTNPNGMNPEIGAVFPTEEGSDYTITNMDVLLLDIYELDWFKGNEQKGMSLALVLNDQVGIAPNTLTLDNDKLKLYGEECARKVVTYLRKTVSAVQNIPIYVTLYNSTTVDQTLPGTFFEEVYFKSKTNGEFSAIDDQWVLFPTTEASELDGTNGTYFDRYKESLRNFLNQDVSIIGKGHYIDKKLTELRINVTMRARGSDEAYAAIQLLNEKLSIFSSTSFKITVDIMSDNVHVAMIERLKGSSETHAILAI